jgi:hypothetical protein
MSLQAVLENVCHKLQEQNCTCSFKQVLITIKVNNTCGIIHDITVTLTASRKEVVCNGCTKIKLLYHVLMSLIFKVMCHKEQRSNSTLSMTFYLYVTLIT